MNLQQMKDFVAQNIAYKPDWEILVKDKNGVPYLQIQFVAADNMTGVPERQYCRKWQLTEHMTPTELVRTVHLAVIQAELHELDEQFKYKGKAIYNPHTDVEALVEIADRHDCRTPSPKPTVDLDITGRPRYDVSEMAAVNEGLPPSSTQITGTPSWKALK